MRARGGEIADIEIARGVRLEHLARRHAPAGAAGRTVAGFAGFTRRGPSEGALVVESWEGFVEAFGDDLPGGLLAPAVRAFFAGGGRRARVASAGRPAPGGETTCLLGGTGRRPRGLAALCAVDDVRIVALPDLAADPDPGRAAALYRIALPDLGRRFLVVDPPPGLDPVGLLDWRRRIDAPPGSRAILYHPWLLAEPDGDEGPRPIPPSGALAGMLARGDGTGGQSGAAAGVDLRGIAGVVRTLDGSEIDLLRRHHVNPLGRSGRSGIRALGVRTLDGSSIPVERLIDEIRSAVAERAAWAVFEPPTSGLRQAVVRSVSAYLHGLWARGALVGRTAEEAFLVRCRREPRPDDEAGHLVCEVAVAPVRPAEFIVIAVEEPIGGGAPLTEGQEGDLARR